jgi:hypothetical protein
LISTAITKIFSRLVRIAAIRTYLLGRSSLRGCLLAGLHGGMYLWRSLHKRRIVRGKLQATIITKLLPGDAGSPTMGAKHIRLPGLFDADRFICQSGLTSKLYTTILTKRIRGRIGVTTPWTHSVSMRS